MNVTLTLGEIIDMIEPINYVLDKELPFKLSYKFTEVADKLEEHNSRYQKLRKEMIEKYGEQQTDDDGIPKDEWKLTEETREKFIEEHTELIANESELMLPTISVDELEDISIKPKHLMRLRKLFKEDE